MTDNLKKIHRSLQPCLRAVKDSYFNGSSNQISRSAHVCENVKSELVKVKNVNVNGVVNIDNWHPTLGTMNINLVPMIDNDLAETAGEESQQLTGWRCDSPTVVSNGEILLEVSLCNLLNRGEKV